MPPHTTIPARVAQVTGAAVNGGRSACARACLALGVLAAAAAGTVLAGAGLAAATTTVLYAAPRMKRTRQTIDAMRSAGRPLGASGKKLS